MKTQIVYDMAPCGLDNICERFRASCSLIFSILQKSLNMEAKTHSKTPIHIYQ